MTTTPAEPTPDGFARSAVDVRVCNAKDHRWKRLSGSRHGGLGVLGVLGVLVEETRDRVLAGE
jgi:hypothetical protein